jgi:hypothetical protein
MGKALNFIKNQETKAAQQTTAKTKTKNPGCLP